MIRVYIADESATDINLFRQYLEGVPDMEVVGAASDGLTARADLQRLKPDVLVTDLYMPGLDGYGLIAWAMAHQPLPILVLSEAVDLEGHAVVARCLALGALEARTKPPAGTPEQCAESRATFQGVLRMLSGVRTIRHRPPPARSESGAASGEWTPRPGARPEVVAIGASTGGYRVIQGLLADLPRAYPLPILVALHIEPAFAEGLANTLKASTSLRIRVGCQAERLEGGTVYLADGGHHLVLTPDRLVNQVGSTAGELLTPSADRLFSSVAAAFGPRALGIILTGMGRDGALGLKAMRLAGAQTFGQDESSSVVYGMPKVALEAGAVGRVLTPEQMEEALLEMGRPGGESRA